MALTIVPGKSALQFAVRRSGEVVEGTAPRFTGEVRLDRARPSASEVVLRVEASAMVTGNRLRDRKMRNSHLEVDRFPAIEFRSTSVSLERKGEGPEADRLREGETRAAVLEGTLGLHGRERTIRFPASIRYDNGDLTAEGSLSLRLSDYDIPIPGFLWLKLDDGVTVRFRFTASTARAAGEIPRP